MSHGPVDVFAARNGKILLIQVKSGRGRMSKDDVDLFKRWARTFRAYGELWLFERGGKLEKTRIYSPLNGKAKRIGSSKEASKL